MQLTKKIPLFSLSFLGHSVH